MSKVVKRKRRTQTRHFARFRQIALVLLKYRLHELIQTLGLEQFIPFRWLPTLNPWQKQQYTQPERTRMALEELGVTFVKVGQILSTRNDMIPPEFSLELTKLQSSLQPLPVDTIKKVISDELGRPIDEVFPSFDPDPIGVASIGQAHAATLTDGTDVVVKARKPGVVEQVQEDMEILRHMAENAARNSERPHTYDLRGIVEEITETISAEMDYIREGHNAEHFARFFQSDPSVHIPKIFWQYTTSRVITLERIHGIGILDVRGLDKAGFDRKELAKRSTSLWVKMVFEDDMFHADPHPGNLFVEKDGHLGLIDFGMAGTVDDEVRGHLAFAIKAIMDRDVDRLMDAIIDLGVVSPESSKENLRADLKHVMGHYPASMSISELHLAFNLGELFAVVRRNHVRLPSNSFLLLKTMAMAQSLGKGLDTDFDFFAPLVEAGEEVFKKTYSPSALVRRFPSALADLAALSVGLPQRLSRIVKSIERGEIQVRADVSGVERHLEHLERIVNRVVIGVIVAAVIFGIAMVVLAIRLSG